MKNRLLWGSGLALCAHALASPLAFAQSTTPALADVIVVTGERAASPADLSVRPDATPLEGADITLAIARTPGAARIGNGPLSGQVQYRGLFGERLNLRVDGQRFASGGPNLMDPVFHYAPAALVDAIIIDRGVSPVSEGPGLGGGADAKFKKIDFNDGSSADFGFDVTASARSVDESYAIGGIVGAASDSWRFNILGAWEEGDDTEFPGGVIASTSFERAVFGAAAGMKVGDHTLALDYRRQQTGPSGNPPFPMDIRFFDTDFASARYEGAFDGATVEASFAYADVRHGMNNFDLRPSPPPMRARETFADAKTLSGDLSVTVGFLGGDLELGGDGDWSDHNVRITNPNNPGFFIGNLPAIEISRIGGYAEWNGAAGPVMGEIGVRIDRHDAEASEAAVGPALPMGPRILAGAFNNAGRTWDDVTVDAAMRLWTAPRGGVSWRLTLARKTAAPSYLHRFGWLPTGASGGLADGNIYVGDLDLNVEQAWIAEVGADYRTASAYMRPTIYVRIIDDFIQGVPFDATPGVIDSPVEMVANINGDPTPLRFANVDARIFGADIDAGYDFNGPLRIDAVASWARGERRDIDDNLYRIAPPNLTTGLTWEAPQWSVTFEGRGVATQDRLSVTNSEERTAGYVIANLYGEWQVRDGVKLSAGVENIFNREYEDHLAGYNRVAGSDVALGSRLPGAGRGAFIRISASR